MRQVLIKKKSFLTVLGSKMIESLFSLEQDSFYELSTILQESLEQKHLLVDVPNQTINAMLAKEGWNGSLAKTPDDYLYVVNANLGGTKANYYVSNEMVYRVYSKTRDGLLRAELELTYDHKGTDNAWPGGPYTDYLRVFVQNGSKLTGAKLLIDDEEIDIGNSVATTFAGAYTVFEFPFVIDPQQKARVILYYDLPEMLSLKGSTSTYNLYWQKQAGTNGDKVEFKFNSPFGTQILSSTPEMEIGSNSALYTGMLQKDLEVSISIK